MRHVRTVMFTVTVTRDVMPHVFVYWSNVLAGFVSWTITRGRTHCIVLRESFVVG